MTAADEIAARLHAEREKASSAESTARPNGAAPPTGRIKLLHFREVQARLTNLWYIKRLIPEKGLVLIYGPQGCGKTFLTLEMTMDIACGREVFCRKTKRGRVVYLAAEAGELLINRIAAWRQEWDSDDVEPDFEFVVVPVNLGDVKKRDANELIHLVGKADVVVVDTVARAIGGDENASRDMNQFVATLDELRARLGCTVIAVHHCGWDEEHSRGHSSLPAAIDTEIRVESTGEPGAEVRVAEVTKQRSGLRGDRFAFKLKRVELGLDEDGEMVTDCVVVPSDYVPQKTSKDKLSGLSKRALEALVLLIASEGEWRTAPDGNRDVLMAKSEAWQKWMKDSNNFGEDATFRSNWRRLPSQLAEKGYITFAKDGWVYVTSTPDDGAAPIGPYAAEPDPLGVVPPGQGVPKDVPF